MVLDFRISWAMHLDTPGDTLILGTEGALRIPSTECWNGTVGGPMKLYTDVAGLQTVTELPIIPDEGPGLFDRKIRSSWTPSRAAASACAVLADSLQPGHHRRHRPFGGGGQRGGGCHSGGVKRRQSGQSAGPSCSLAVLPWRPCFSRR